MRRAAAAKGTDADLRRARKAAERVRDAADLSRRSLGGKPAKKIVRRYTELADLLREHDDAVASAQLLRRLGGARGVNGFTLGVLYERELRNAETARRQAAVEAADLAVAVG
jgi:hypothetical protein